MAEDTRPFPLSGWAGYAIGPAAWAVNTQLGQILPYVECGASFRPGPFLSGLGVLLSLAGAWLSYRVSGMRLRGSGMPGFVASIGALLGCLVAFAMMLQTLSMMMVSGCAR